MACRRVAQRPTTGHARGDTSGRSTVIIVLFFEGQVQTVKN
jgi:hypothetical protein